jgi:hypothetical protein
MSRKIILVATANPTDTSLLRTDEFITAIQQGLQDAQKLLDYEVVPVVATDLDNFLQQLELYKPAILHLVGHGDRLDRFIFENEEGGQEFAKPTQFANHLHHYKSKLECVVISACHSQTLAKNIVQEIGFAIGYDDALAIEVAKAYTEKFYFYIATGNSYEFASAKTLTAMLNKIPENKIPQLFVKSTPMIGENINKEEIFAYIENNNLDEAFKKFIELVGNTPVHTVLVYSYEEYQQYKAEKSNDIEKLSSIIEPFVELLNKWKSNKKTNHSNSQPKNMNKEQIITLAESNRLDEAFKQFITLTRGTELYTNFLMPLYIEYQEYKDDKLAGKNVSGKLADISQRLVKILDRYE